MKCSQTHCTHEFTGNNDVPIVVTLNDTKAGDFFGLYCSYECIIREVGTSFLHLQQKKPLAQFTTPKTNKEFVDQVKKVFPDEFNNDIAIVAPAQAVQAPQPEAAPEPEPPEIQAPVNVIQEDGVAWGNNGPGVIGGDLAAMENDPVKIKINKIHNYMDNLSSKLTEIMEEFEFTSIVEMGIHTNLGQYGAHDVNKCDWLANINGYALKGSVTPACVEDNLVLYADFGNLTKFSTTIDVDEAPLEALAPALSKHMQSIAKELKEVADTHAAAKNAVAINADDEPF